MVSPPPAKARENLLYGSRYSYSVLLLLTLAYVLSFADRMLLAMMIDPVRASLGLSDTQISLLLGLAFALFYGLLSIPLGRLADTGSRTSLLGIGVLAWSIATVACGMVGTAWQLFLARLGVGAGEATLSPASYSLIADYFPPQRVGFAMSVYGTGITLGAGAAMALSGVLVGLVGADRPVMLPLLGETEGWRAAFLFLGLPGIAFALILKAAIREPARRGLGGDRAAPPATEFIRFLADHRDALLPILLGYTTLSIMNYGISSWAATFFLRIHGWSPALLGLVYGAILGIGATVGVVAGGVLADRLVRSGRQHGSALVVLGSMVAQGPVFLAAFLIGNSTVAIVLFGVATTISGAAIGLQNVTLQNMTPNRMRGLMTGLFLMLANMFGLGIGPTLIAATSDHIFTGPQALGSALATAVAVCLPLACVLVLRGLAPARRMLTIQFDSFASPRDPAGEPARAV